MPQPADPAAEDPPPSSARIGIVVAGFCALLNMYAPQAILPTLGAAFHAGPVALGLTITATTFATAICAPLAGALADRVGRKRSIVLGLALLALPTLLSALSANLAQLIATRFLQGLFMPAAFAAAIAYVGEEWPPRQVGRVMALYVTGTVAGGFCGRFLGGLAADLAGWHATFFLLAALDLAGALAVWRLLPDQRRFAAETNLARALLAVPGLLRQPRLLSIYAVGFTVLFALVNLFTYVNFHLAAPPYAFGPAALGFVFCVYLIGIAVTPLAGPLIDRLGQRRTVVAASLLGASGAAVTLAGPVALVMAGLAMFCTGAFVAQAAATSELGLVAGANRSAAAGLYLTFYYAGAALGALLPGYAWNWGGWPACVALAGAVEGAMAAIAWGLWADPARR